MPFIFSANMIGSTRVPSSKLEKRFVNKYIQVSPLKVDNSKHVTLSPRQTRGVALADLSMIIKLSSRLGIGKKHLDTSMVLYKETSSEHAVLEM
jgi:hypothetical protein